MFGRDIFPARRSRFALQPLWAFQRSPQLQPSTSKFDAVLRRQPTLPSRRSAACHGLRSGKGYLPQFSHGQYQQRQTAGFALSNFGYHAIGAPRNTELPATADAKYNDLGLCETLRLDKSFDNQTSLRLFKTPTLRNVELTGPYMHNGVFKSLREAVAFMRPATPIRRLVP